MPAEAGSGTSADSGAAGAPPEPAQAVLARLARDARADAPAVALAALGMAGVGLGRVPDAVLGGWCATVALLLAVRHGAFARLAEGAGPPAPERLRRADRVVLAGAAVFGASAAASGWLPVAERAVLGLLLAGTAALTSIGTSGVRQAAAGALLLGPAALAWLLVPAPGLSIAIRVGVAGAFCGGAVLLWRRARVADALSDEVHALRSAHAALGARHDDALGRLRSAEAAAAATIDAVGHRLRQPVHALRLFASSLAEQPLAPRAADLARRLDAAGQALAHDLETLLDVSRAHLGVLRPERAPVDVEGVVGRVLAPLEIDAAGLGMSLGHELEPGLRVDTDRRLLERLLRTLVVGALERGASGGGVSIEARRDAGRCVLEVIDGGRDLHPVELARLLDARLPADPSDDPSHAVAARLSAGLEASLSVEAEGGAGTRVRLVLPLAAAPARVAASDGALAGLHVLVVDDEAMVRAGTRFVLEDRGCRVSVAADASQAMDAALADRPDVALIDLRLGRGESGLQLAARLRGRWSGLALVMISGDRPRQAVDAVETAGLPVLHKPIDVERLVRALREAYGALPEGAASAVPASSGSPGAPPGRPPAR